MFEKIDTNAVMILLNVIYFKGNCNKSFAENYTK
ncbi:serpin family protein [Trichodesmium erythraeum]|nr:hypothetical protein [Trichodesmium erythraeum GBRTRLIN201]